MSITVDTKDNSENENTERDSSPWKLVEDGKEDGKEDRDEEERKPELGEMLENHSDLKSEMKKDSRIHDCLHTIQLALNNHGTNYMNLLKENPNASELYLKFVNPHLEAMIEITKLCIEKSY